jgi:hypothetical protein
MKIAILAWGSLIKQPGDLRIVDDSWHLGGPALPVELSRLSQKRGHLTYVIDERHQRRAATRYAISRYRQLENAIADLACREGCSARSIGYVQAGQRQRHRSRTGLWKDIQQWVRANQLDAAVWTDLPPKFPREFSLETALALTSRSSLCAMERETSLELSVACSS